MMDGSQIENKRNVKDVADWCRRTLATAKATGDMDTRAFVQNAQMIVEALDFVAEFGVAKLEGDDVG